MAILDDATREPDTLSAERLDQILAEIQAIGRPNEAESVAIIRADRDR